MCRVLCQKVLTHFRCNLPVGHFVRGLHGEDPRLQSFMLNPFCQLAFCLTRAEYLDGFSVPDGGYHLIVVLV